LKIFNFFFWHFHQKYELFRLQAYFWFHQLVFVQSAQLEQGGVKGVLIISGRYSLATFSIYLNTEQYGGRKKTMKDNDEENVSRFDGLQGRYMYDKGA